MDERPDVPPLELERWLLSEQTDVQRAQTEARLAPAQREALRAEHEALRARLFARLPPPRFTAQVLAEANASAPERVSRQGGRRQGLLQLSALAAVAAALALGAVDVARA